MSLPKPFLVSASTNSLSVGWSKFDISKQQACYLQYRTTNETWGYCHSIPVDRSGTVLCNTLNNLQPRTPYYIRFVMFDRLGKVEDVGPQTVLDTADLDSGDCSNATRMRNSTKDYVKKCASCFIDEFIFLRMCQSNSPNYKTAVV